MTPDDFIVRLRSFVLDSNATYYDEFYSTFPPERADTPFLKGMVELYAGLSPEHRDVLAQMYRKVASEAVGNTLTFIDEGPTRVWSGLWPMPRDLAQRFYEAEEKAEAAQASLAARW